MFNALTSRLSSKRVNKEVSASYNSLVDVRLVNLLQTNDSFAKICKPRAKHDVEKDSTYVHHAVGSLDLSLDSYSSLHYCSAEYIAHGSSTNTHVLQVHKTHLLAAVIKYDGKVKGGRYMRQHLHEELLSQLKKHEPAMAIQQSIQALEKNFKKLHPYNMEILEAVNVTIVYIDFKLRKLHLASNGGCLCAVYNIHGTSIIAEVGRRKLVPNQLGITYPSDVACLDVDTNFGGLILGSTGFWSEVSQMNALIHTKNFYAECPYGHKGSAAAYLLTLALHCVTKRLTHHPDRRMKSLQSVTNLVSLYKGDKSQFSHSERQPVRRCRGDVHDDMLAIVLSLRNDGLECNPHHKLIKLSQTEESKPAAAQKHWKIVKTTLILSRAEFRMHVRQKWYNLVDTLCQQK